MGSMSTAPTTACPSIRHRTNGTASRHPATSRPVTYMNAVLTALGPAPVAIDAIARATGLNVLSVQIALLELDLAGRIERQGHSLVALKGLSARGCH